MHNPEERTEQLRRIKRRLPDGWKPLSYHPEQQRLLRSKKLYRAVVAGRGSGKTEIARRYLVLKAMEPKPWSDPKYFFLGPTADQAERIGWKPLLKLIPPRWIVNKHENKKVIYLINGAEIHVCSGQKPERLEGVQWDGGVEDECSDQNPTIPTLNLGPAMTHRRAWFWRIGVPKRRGIGAQEFKKFWELGLDGTHPLIDSFHWKSEDILSADVIEQRKQDLSPQDYNEQYCASWEDATGMAYPDFSDKNYSEGCVYFENLPIVVGSDFNVDPMAWVLGHLVDGVFYQFDEIWLRGTNTYKTLDYLHEKYKDHKAGWIFAGDASSQSRKTSAHMSDYLIIANDTRFTPKQMNYPRSNPAILDRIAATNAAIRSAAGSIRYYVHPRCIHTISDLAARHFKRPEEGKRNPNSELNDVGDLGHITDALGYVIWEFMPLQLELAPEETDYSPLILPSMAL